MGDHCKNDAVTYVDGVSDLHPSEPCPRCGWNGGPWFRWLVSGKGVKVLCGALACNYETDWFEDRDEAITYWNVTSKLSR